MIKKLISLLLVISLSLCMIAVFADDLCSTGLSLIETREYYHDLYYNALEDYENYVVLMEQYNTSKITYWITFLALAVEAGFDAPSQSDMLSIQRIADNCSEAGQALAGKYDAESKYEYYKSLAYYSQMTVYYAKKEYEAAREAASNHLQSGDCVTCYKEWLESW